jgi:hypothetical protein
MEDIYAELVSKATTTNSTHIPKKQLWKICHTGEMTSAKKHTAYSKEEEVILCGLCGESQDS